MNPEVKQLWIEALRSGEYKQGEGALHNNITDEYCCLGVLCDVALKNGVELTIDKTEHNTAFATRTASLPHKVVSWSGMRDDYGTLPEGFEILGGACNQGTDYYASLVALNDDGVGFIQIADFIENMF